MCSSSSLPDSSPLRLPDEVDVTVSKLPIVDLVRSLTIECDLFLPSAFQQKPSERPAAMTFKREPEAVVCSNAVIMEPGGEPMQESRSSPFSIVQFNPLVCAEPNKVHVLSCISPIAS